MRRIQWAVVGIGATLLCLHALFPPRVYKYELRPTSRAFILSSDFYDTDIVHVGKNDPNVPGVFIKRTSNPAILDYDRFVALSTAISAVTIGLAAFLGLVGGLRRQTSARSTALPTAPTR